MFNALTKLIFNLTLPTFVHLFDIFKQIMTENISDLSYN